ncbi:O-methyltransferase [Edaphobacter bradus]|uniref:O-methyltransferase n=1 Tax=Edaphobacter bradus TaxID=2259016 RepID=UPI0021DFE8DA|nr:O-methyltransferase [Edaphobacter bradus]
MSPAPSPAPTPDPAQALWTAVDQYIDSNLIPPDPVLEEALAANARDGLPSIDVTPSQGKFLYLLAKISGAKTILEVGTLGGYSTIWLARALPPNGKLITLEILPKHAEVAAKNIERAGLTSLVEQRVGPALDLLAHLHEIEDAGPFDLIFIDADKANNANYHDWALRLSHPGTVIITDNVIREGAILNPDDPDPDVQGTRRLFEKLGAEPRVEATALQTVGSKKYDGFTIALVKG